MTSSNNALTAQAIVISQPLRYADISAQSSQELSETAERQGKQRGTNKNERKKLRPHDT
jgi:hypothetical protein